MKIWGYCITTKPQGTGKFPAASPILSFLGLNKDPWHAQSNMAGKGAFLFPGFCFLERKGFVSWVRMERYVHTYKNTYRYWNMDLSLWGIHFIMGNSTLNWDLMS